MTMRRHALSIVCVLVMALACVASHAQAARIVAGTSLIEDMVHDLMGGEGDVLTLIQGAACPGHDHGRTRDFMFAAKADIVLIHGFQQTMPQFTAMMGALGDTPPPVVVMGVNGSWLIPENQKRALRMAADALKAVFPAQASAIEIRAVARMERVDAVAAECAALLVPTRGKRVMVAQMQAEFVQWAGLHVVKTYGRAEDMSARDLVALARAARAAGISGVVDNYQSGPDAGLPLALELDVPHVTLSNFPGHDDAVPDYFSLLRANVALLARL